MSGLEIAGVLLGTFPLIISGLEHYRDVAKVAGFWWATRKRYLKCRDDVRYHEIMYRRNLKELLMPIVNDSKEIELLISDPGGNGWKEKSLQGDLEVRLDESYPLYLNTITLMNETADDLRNELSFDKDTVQAKLSSGTDAKKQPTSRPSKSASMKSTLDYQKFKIKFSLGESVRDEMLDQLKECNERLEKLLSTSDKVSSLSTIPTNSKRSSSLESALRKAWKKSDLLFKALHEAWQCSCQQYHYANLRLEHRTVSEICFDVILAYISPNTGTRTPWSWKEFRCGQMQLSSCSSPTPLPNPSPMLLVSTTPIVSKQVKAPPKRVAFSTTNHKIPIIELHAMADPRIELCQLLGCEQCNDCIGVIGHDDETYHLHTSKKRIPPVNNNPLTLDHILSMDFEGTISRRQRYWIALLLASSVAQLQFTPWLRTGLTKEDVLFFTCEDDQSNIPYGEPFIRQGFQAHHQPKTKVEVDECNFYSLGILLLELCFGRRLEDHPLRKRHPRGDPDSKQAFDLMAAMQWSKNVHDEGGSDYAMAVKWCFLGASSPDLNKSWRSEIITSVVRPLEQCQEHFKATNAGVQ